jgi:hypothetical protein
LLKPLRYIVFLALFFLTQFGYAKIITSDTKKALESLVASQNLAQTWPAIMRNARISGEDNVKKGAMDSLENNSHISPEQLGKAKIIISELAPQISNDIDEFHKSIDVTQLTQNMVEVVYPKYYSAQEIQELANFYKSAAFQKTVAISLAVAEESKRTGVDTRTLWAKYESKLSQQDRQTLVGFQNSAVGQKQKSVGRSVNSDSLNYLQSQLTRGIDEIVKKYAFILNKKLE